MDMKVSSTIGYERRHNDAAREIRRGPLRRARDRRRCRRSRRTSRRSSTLNRGPLLTRRRRGACRSRRARSSRGSATARWSSTCAPTCSSTRRTSPAPVCIPIAPRRLRHQAGVDRRPRAGGRADRPRRRGRASRPRSLAAAVGITQHRRLPGRRHDELARGAARGRPRSSGSTSAALHERLAAEPDLQVLDVREQAEWDAGHIPGSIHTPYHDVRGIPDGHRPGAADRGDLLLGAAQRGGGEPAAAPRRRGRDPRRRRRRRHLGARAGQRHWPSATPRPPRPRPAPPGYLFERGREVDLNVVCKNCGSEVSPYITECPYCGQRLRKRAPKLPPGRGERASWRLPSSAGGGSRRKPTRGAPAGVAAPRADRTRRSPLVLAGGALYLASGASSLGLYDLGAIIGPLDGDWWRLVAAQFVYENVGYLFAVAVAVAIFGTSLERRYGAPVMLLIFLGAGAAGMYLASEISGLPGRDGRQRLRARAAVRVGDPRPARPPVRRRHRERPVRRRRDRGGARPDAGARDNGRRLGRPGRRRRRLARRARAPERA